MMMVRLGVFILFLPPMFDVDAAARHHWVGQGVLVSKLACFLTVSRVLCSRIVSEVTGGTVSV